MCPFTDTSLCRLGRDRLQIGEEPLRIFIHTCPYVTCLTYGCLLLYSNKEIGRNVRGSLTFCPGPALPCGKGHHGPTGDQKKRSSLDSIMAKSTPFLSSLSPPQPRMPSPMPPPPALPTAAAVAAAAATAAAASDAARARERGPVLETHCGLKV